MSSSYSKFSGYHCLKNHKNTIYKILYFFKIERLIKELLIYQSKGSNLNTIICKYVDIYIVNLIFYVSIYFALVWVSVLSKNVKTVEPIRTKFSVGHHMTQGNFIDNQIFKNLSKFDFHKKKTIQNPRTLCFVLYCIKRENVHS